MLGTQKLDEILNCTKMLGDSRGWVLLKIVLLPLMTSSAPKFIKFVATNLKMKTMDATPKGKS